MHVGCVQVAVSFRISRFRGSRKHYQLPGTGSICIPGTNVLWVGAKKEQICFSCLSMLFIAITPDVRCLFGSECSESRDPESKHNFTNFLDEFTLSYRQGRTRRKCIVSYI